MKLLGVLAVGIAGSYTSIHCMLFPIENKRIGHNNANTFFSIEAGKANLCPELPHPDNGDVQVKKSKFGLMAIYSCKINFHLSGRMQRKCGRSGRWSGSSPRCLQGQQRKGTLVRPCAAVSNCCRNAIKTEF